MIYTVDEWRKAITKLIQMTSNGEVTWKSYSDYEADVWTEVDRSYSCLLNDKRYVVAAVRSKYFLDEEEYFWANRTVFSIFSATIPPTFLGEAPKDLNVVESLYSVVEESFAYSQNALGDLLK